MTDGKREPEAIHVGQSKPLKRLTIILRWETMEDFQQRCDMIRLIFEKAESVHCAESRLKGGLGMKVGRLVRRQLLTIPVGGGNRGFDQGGYTEAM